MDAAVNAAGDSAVESGGCRWEKLRLKQKLVDEQPCGIYGNGQVAAVCVFDMQRVGSKWILNRLSLEIVTERTQVCN